MTIEEVENTKDIDMQKKELEKKIEVFKKNEETVYDLLALYEHLTSTKKTLKDSFLLCLLVDKLIQDWKDPDVVFIPLEEDGPFQILENLCNEYLDVKEDLEQVPDVELEEEFSLSEKKEQALDMLRSLSWRVNDIGELSFSDLCLNDSSFSVAVELLLSDISFQRRLMLFELMCQKGVKKRNLEFLEYFFDQDSRGLKRRTKDEVIEKKKALFDAFVNDEGSYSFSEFIDELKDQKMYSWFVHFQKMGIDVSRYCWDSSSLELERECGDVSIVSFIAKEKYLYPFRCLYEDPSYQKLPARIRKNNDLAIVQQLQFSDLLNFIELPNFQITMDLVPVIMDRICEQEKILPRPDFKIFVMERLVARRENASNPKEYRRLSHVLTAIEEAPDCFDEIRKLEQEKQKLIQKRQEVVGKLSDLNEILQDQVPGKRIIKNLEFHKKLS
jgi:hypothetical protein